ncbi:MAG: ABC transporter transmembrane domain-containing protein, partial [Planctomycetota bacterium]
MSQRILPPSVKSLAGPVVVPRLFVGRNWVPNPPSPLIANSMSSNNFQPKTRLVAPHLQAREPILAEFEFDLDGHSQFRSEWVWLTPYRLLSARRAPHTGGERGRIGGSNSRSRSGSASRSSDNDNDHGGEDWDWHSWPLTDELGLHYVETGGTGALELLGPDRRLAEWRYTNACAAAVHRFTLQFERHVATNLTTSPTAQPTDATRSAETNSNVLALSEPSADATDGRVSDATTVCPRCGGMTNDDGVCAACAPQLQPPPRQALYRLARFARPRLGLILWGTALMILSTAAGLVPPYIIGPFYDQVLEPLDAGKPVPPGLAAWYLSWLGGAAVAAWLLSWARNDALCRASELISADLRNHTYGHLQRLSLEFF